MNNIQNWDNLINSFLEENKKVNLSAIKDYENVYQKHILDSIEINKIFDLNKEYKIIDVGTGGGFPLLPISITNPSSFFIGIDGTSKKINAVNNLIKELNLQNVEVKWSRSEDLNNTFDILVSRAVAYIDKLLKKSYHLVKKNGYFILYKIYSFEEDKEIEKQCKKYNMEIEKKHFYSIEENDIQRVIYIIKKK